MKTKRKNEGRKDAECQEEVEDSRNLPFAWPLLLWMVAVLLTLLALAKIVDFVAEILQSLQTQLLLQEATEKEEEETNDCCENSFKCKGDGISEVPRLRKAEDSAAASTTDEESLAASAATTVAMETARRSVGLSLALVQQLSHVDSSSEEDEEDEVDQLLSATVTSNGAIRKCEGSIQQQQQQHRQNREKYEKRGCPDGSAAGDEEEEEEEMPNCQTDTRLHRIYTELIDTERRYCTCLWKLVNSIADSLISMNCLTNCQLSCIIPGCLPQLHSLHCQLLKKLESEVNSIPAAFLDFLDLNSHHLLHLYTNYLRQFSLSIQTIGQLRITCQEFDKNVKQLQSDPEFEGLDIPAFLLTPVQRLPRYLLLLRQMKSEKGHSIEEEAQLAACIARLIRTLDSLNVPIHGALLEAGRLSEQQHQHQSNNNNNHHNQQHQQHQQNSPCHISCSSSSFPSSTTTTRRRRRRSTPRPSLPRRLRRQRSCGADASLTDAYLSCCRCSSCCCCCCLHFAAQRREKLQTGRRCSSQPPDTRIDKEQQKQQQKHAVPTVFHLPSTPPRRQQQQQQQQEQEQQSERSLSVGNLAACDSSTCVQRQRQHQHQHQHQTSSSRRKSSSAFKESLRKIFLTKWKGSEAASGSSHLLTGHNSSPDF